MILCPAHLLGLRANSPRESLIEHLTRSPQPLPSDARSKKGEPFLAAKANGPGERRQESFSVFLVALQGDGPCRQARTGSATFQMFTY